ncbi:MAG: hypothetical protein LUG83_08535 [Lachnospiraceae bacterium]|nr:hypothetical protein [Lachnospiraceae bacterium]
MNKVQIIKNVKLKEYMLDFLIGGVSFAFFLILFVGFEWNAMITAVAIAGLGELAGNYIREVWLKNE